MRDIEIDWALRDRARGLMVGIAAGNLLGIPNEFGGWNRESIKVAYPNGIREIDAKQPLILPTHHQPGRRQCASSLAAGTPRRHAA